jgi:Ca-activated chloride channel family protein
MNTFSFFRRAILLVGLMLIGGNIVMAQDDKDEDKTLSPYFVVISENPETDELPLKETSVKATVVGSIADVTVKQVYVNSGKNPLEAIYTFPMSTKAAVYGMQMTIGKRIVRAQIEEKKKARADYEKAKQEGKRASLLEQSRPNVFTMNVSNIMVGDTIVVELNYTELLVPEKGVYSFVYPTVVGPRYSNKNKSQAGPDDQFVASPYTKSGVMPTYKFGYELTINSGIPIQDVVCKSHKMNVKHEGLKKTVVQLDKSETNGGNRDVIVNYSLQGSQIESGVLLYEGEDENFFLLMVQPPKKVQKEDIPPREYIFIVDVSGSMWGFPMTVTKTLMRNLIVNLRPTDKFNVVLFSGAAKVFSPQSVDATKENIALADDFIQSGNAYGGTEVLNALRMADAIPRPDEDIARTFVMSTDGYVAVDKESIEFVREHSDNTNFFIFGIGSSVNRYLIEGIAFAGHGEPMIVTNQSEASAAAERFRQYISTPVLTRIKMNAGKFKVYDVEPMAVPDMMAERPIMIFGKYTGKPTGTVTLTGKVGRKAYKQTFDLSQVKADKSNAALRYLWARERIKYLDYLGGQYSRDDTPIAEQITKLGLKYNLMTNYTSFIAIDEVVVNKDGKQTTVKQPIPMPEGVSDYAVGHEVAELSMARNGVMPGTSVVAVGGIGYSVEEEMEEEEVFVVVEDDPEFPGGMDSLKAFIERNLVYPQLAKDNKIEGKVFVTFVVEKDGSISGVKVLRDIGYGCGAEAIRVVMKMPKWKPGKQRGKPMRVQFNLPIEFKLK